MNPTAEAANPATEPARLAEIAQQHPELAATVAANPATYPGLLEWIVQYGDPTAKAAARVRMGISPTPPPPPPAGVAPAAVSAPAAVGTGPHVSPRVFAIGGGVLAVVALGVVAALVIPSLIGGGGSSVTVTTAEILHQPRLDAWAISNPFDGEGSSNDTVNLSTHEVGQDRAVLGWTLNSYESDSIVDARASLIDTRTGSTIWSIEIPAPLSGAVGGLGNGPTVLAVNDGSHSQLISIDGSGRQLSETALGDSFNLFTASDASTTYLAQKGVMIGNDVLATDSKGQLFRLSTSDLTQEAWSINAPDGYAAVTADRVIAGGSAYSLVSGKPLAWNGDPDLSVFSGGYGLFGTRSSGEETFDLVGLTAQGDEIWSKTFSVTILQFVSSELVVAADLQSGKLSAISLDDGRELWTLDVGADAFTDASLYTQYGTDVIWTPNGSGQGTIVALDAKTGKELYRNSDITTSGSVLGGTRNVVYVGTDSMLQAFNPRTGDELWSVSTGSGDNEYYSFVILGGRIVMERTLDSSTAQFRNEVVLEGVG